MKILKSNEADFKAEFKKLVNRSDMDMKSVMPIVTGIIDDIKSRGDEALNEQIAKFDKWEVNGNLAITQDEMKKNRSFSMNVIATPPNKKTSPRFRVCRWLIGSVIKCLMYSPMRKLSETMPNHDTVCQQEITICA